MANKKGKKIELANCNSIRFPVVDKVEHDMFIIGNFDGIFGTFVQTPTGKLDFNHEAGDALKVNGGAVIRTIKSKKHVYLLSTEETAKYFMDFLTICRDKGFFDSVGRSAAINKYFHYSIIDLNKDDREIIDCVNNKLFKNLNNMKFDNVIQNPPYNGTLHLDFLKMGLDLLSDKGKMVIIEPATWLINIRKNGNAKIYDNLKKRLKGHIESVVIENQNRDFNIENQVPFATTVIDFSNTHDDFEFVCCGEKKRVKSLYDCNLIGDYDIIWSILNKFVKHGDMMNKHYVSQHDKKMPVLSGVTYNTFVEGLFPHIGWHSKSTGAYKNNEKFRKTKDGEYFEPYVRSLSDDYIGTELEHGKNKEENIKPAVFGSAEEIENWHYNVRNLQIFRFLPITLIYDQNNNNIKDFTPWLVDKKYTNDEANRLFGLTDEEISFIDRTVKKYERSSPWFKRYMCGPDSVSDEEVNNFIKSL